MDQRICTVEGCERNARGNGLCVGHDQRVRRTGTVGPAEFRRTPMSQPPTCEVDGCDRSAKSRGMCAAHYERARKGLPLVVPIPSHRKAPPPPCAVEGCNDVSKARGWCNRHYQRWVRTGETGPSDLPRYGLIEVCSAEGCEREHRTKGWCDAHYRRWRRGIPTDSLRFLVIKERSSVVTYNAAHGQIKARRGSASNHPCIECGGSARTWAYQHNDPDEMHDAAGHPYSLKYVECYEAMCTSCHNILDRDIDERQARRLRAG